MYCCETSDKTNLMTRGSFHYYINLLLNGVKVTAVINTGSNSTILSVRACNALGLSYASDDGKV